MVEELRSYLVVSVRFSTGEIDVSNLHRFLRKGWTSVSQISEESKDKEQVADPPPLCSVPAGKREKQELGVCSVCL